MKRNVFFRDFFNDYLKHEYNYNKQYYSLMIGYALLKLNNLNLSLYSKLVFYEEINSKVESQ